jgi:hypothetical protein
VTQAGQTEQETKAALAEAVGDVAANLAAMLGAPLVGDPSQNQLLRVCFGGLEASGEGNYHVQQTATAALAQARDVML